MAHEFVDYYWYGGGFGWDRRLIQRCVHCNQLRETKPGNEDVVRDGHRVKPIPSYSGVLGAYGDYAAGPTCAGKPVIGLQVPIE